MERDTLSVLAPAETTDFAAAAINAPHGHHGVTLAIYAAMLVTSRRATVTIGCKGTKP